MPIAPPKPADLPEESQTEGPLWLRYEDIAQDGRLHLTALPHAFGTLIWSRAFADHPITRLVRQEGILPILTKLVIAGEDAPLPVDQPLWGRGAFALARAGSGENRRLILHVWVDFEGARGRTHGPPPPGAGEVAPVGSVYGEHVFTRPFAPPGERRVTQFPPGELPEIPQREHTFVAPDALLEVPEGAAARESELAPDPSPIVFGLAHTDSNQHVNSLVYPRIFEEAALRRMRALGERPDGRLLRRIEVGYRRPCFAGDEASLRLRLYDRDGALGAVGVFESANGNAAPLTYARGELA